MSTHFFDLDHDQLVAFAEEHGFRRFLAGQLMQWVYQRGVSDPEQMTDLSKADRVRLAQLMHFQSAEELTSQVASDGTRKLLLGWNEPAEDGATALAQLSYRCQVAAPPPPRIHPSPNALALRPRSP